MGKMAIVIEADNVTKDQANQILTRLRQHLADKPNVRVRGQYNEKLEEQTAQQ